MTPHAVQDLAGFLAGRWRVRREVVPVRGVPAGGFEGEATFAPIAGGELLYREHGTVHIGDHHGEASRTLRYRVDGARAVVCFDDGRLFHDLDLRTGTWRADHPCGDDLYRGRFTVTGPHAWEQRWSVRGPTEAYRMRTRLDRLAS